MHRRKSGLRILDLRELRFDAHAVPKVAFGFAVDDRFGQLHPRNDLRIRVYRQQLRHPLIQLHTHPRVVYVARHAAVGIAWKVEIEVVGRAPLQIAHVDAGLAEPLHRDEADHRARPLNPGGISAGAAVAVAPGAGAQVGLLGSPFSCERANVACGHAGLRFLPFGRFRDTVGFAEDVVGPLLEADGVSRNVVLVVKTLGYPDIGNGNGIL